jgi:hypothetical protein
VEVRGHPRLINSNVESGLIISGLSAVYVALGVLGHFGKGWIAEGHERPALIGILLGLGIAGYYFGDRPERTGNMSVCRQFAAASVLAGIVGFALIATGAWRNPVLVSLAGIYLGIAGLHYLGDRAEGTGDVSARRFTAASILAGVVRFALVAAGALLAALMVAVALIAIILPWLPWPYDELVWRKPSLVILAILAGTFGIVLAAVSEFVVRRNSIRKAQLTQEPSPYDSVKPETTIAIASTAFLLSLSVYSIRMLFPFSLLMARKSASVFPKGAVTWLWERHDLSWALLPCCLVTFAIIAAMHAYRRARWTGAIEAAPKLLDSAMKVAITCIGSSLLLLVLGFVAPILGSK